MWTRPLVVIAFLGRVAAAQPAAQPAQDPEIEQKFRAEIEAVSAEAAAAFDAGNAARAAEKLDEAVQAYRKAIELAPNVDHAHRRLCSVLARQGQVDHALTACERAQELAPESPYNKMTLAAALLERNGAGDLPRAAGLARQGAEALPNDVTAHVIWCRAALQQDNRFNLRKCTERLLTIEPDGLFGNYLAAGLAAEDGDFDEARRHLDTAKAAGLEQAVYDDIAGKLDAAEDATATFPRWVRTAFWIGVWAIGAWLAVLVVLLVAGFVLSSATLRTVNRAALEAAEGEGTESERRLRKLYRSVLALSGVFFYLSMPMMLGTIVAAGAGAIIVCFAIGVIPVKLVLLVGIVVFATVGAILRSLFVRAVSTPPGEPLDLAKHPKLRAMLDDVASTIGTRPVDVAYLTPGTDMAVTERGGVWTSLRGKRTERSLIMGIGLFEGMTQLQLRSILAHEYGHFRNADTAGGGFALSVRRSLFTLIVRLAQSGVAAAWNPVWWFVRGFHRAYLGISHGASRLQEVLADRWSIRAYGSEAFIGGYRHVVARSVAFDADVDSTISEVVEKDRPLPNLYRYQPETKKVSDADLAAAIENEMVREPSIYDSHPSPRQRLDWATQLAVQRAPQPDDNAPVWDLFADREELERAMTANVRDQIRANHGITIADADRVHASASAASASSASEASASDVRASAS